MLEDEHISANHVKVMTERGTTYLMGLASEREARIATEIARRTAGVRKVVNLIELLDGAREQAPVAHAQPTAPAPENSGVVPIQAPTVTITPLN